VGYPHHARFTPDNGYSSDGSARRKSATSGHEKAQRHIPCGNYRVNLGGTPCTDRCRDIGAIVKEGKLNAIGQVRRSILIALLFTAMLIFSPVTARAEVLTLDCYNDGSVYVIDLSARSAMGRRFAGGPPNDLTNVEITDSTISFVDDWPSVHKITVKIDRITGMANNQYYYYGASGPAYASLQCKKIPNKAF
jgi:hypothetical protein